MNARARFRRNPQDAPDRIAVGAVWIVSALIAVVAFGEAARRGGWIGAGSAMFTLFAVWLYVLAGRAGHAGDERGERDNLTSALVALGMALALAWVGWAVAS